MLHNLFYYYLLVQIQSSSSRYCFPCSFSYKLQSEADSVLQLRAGALKPQPGCEPIANLIHFFGDRVMTKPAAKLSHSKTASSYINQ